jgi:hypothetical protein
MNFNINVSQLIQGVITAVINSVAVLIAGRYVARAVERIEKKAINGKPKE